MTWFKVDDQLHAHRKVAALESGKHFAEAIALWTLAGSWCASQLQDGEVPTTQLRRLVPFDARKAAIELVRVGLWEVTEGGYRFRSWHEYQPSRADIETKRGATAERVRNYRERTAKRDSSALRAANTDDGNALLTPPPIPSRPVPSQSEIHTPLAREATPPTKLDPEHVRAAYVAAYRTATGGKLEPLIARGFGNPIWDELALAVVDAETCARLLASAFADDFCRRQGFTPTVIRGCVDRLLLNGPEGPKQTRASPRGMAPPAASEAHAEVVRKHGGSDGIARTPI